MLYYIKNIQNYWTDYGFEILFYCSLILIFVLFLYRWISGEEGTYNVSYYAPVNNHKYKPYSTHKRVFSKKQSKDSKGELECRRVMSEIFNKRFDKARPHFLRNPVTGGNHNLEIEEID